MNVRVCVSLVCVVMSWVRWFNGSKHLSPSHTHTRELTVERWELTLESCSLTSTHVPWHMHAHTI